MHAAKESLYILKLTVQRLCSEPMCKSKKKGKIHPFCQEGLAGPSSIRRAGRLCGRLRGCGRGRCRAFPQDIPGGLGQCYGNSEAPFVIQTAQHLKLRTSPSIILLVPRSSNSVQHESLALASGPLCFALSCARSAGSHTTASGLRVLRQCVPSVLRGSA